MRRDSSLEARRGVNVAGLAMVVGALVLGLLLSVAILRFEGSQRAAAQAAEPPAEQADEATQPPAAQAAPVAQPSATEAPTATEPPLAQVATAQPPATSPASSIAAAPAEAGKAIFANTCNSCHPNGQAGVGPALKGRSAAVITRTVRNGKEIMPAFSTAQLSDQQLSDIIAYIQTLR